MKMRRIMKFQVTTITIEHGKMTDDKIEEIVSKLFDNMNIENQSNIISYSYKTNNHNHRIN